MNEAFEQCLSVQSGKQKRQRSPLQVKFITQKSYQAPKQDEAAIVQQRIVLDYSKQNLFTLNESMVWVGLLHLMLDNNKISEFNTDILKHTPQLQNLSISDNSLKYFGKLSSNLVPKLSTLNLSKNLLHSIDESIFSLHLIKLYIQQNKFTTLSNKIANLSVSLEVLGLGWGIFCQQQFDFILEDQKLKVFFAFMEAMPDEITFEFYISNYKSISEVVAQTQMNDSINSSNEKLITQITAYLNNPNSECESQFQYINDYKQNLMHVAVFFDEIGILNYLLDTRIEFVNQIDLKGHTPLSLAIEKKYFRLVSLILEYKVNVNLGGGLQSSNMHIAAQHCQVELLEDLLNQGANPSPLDIFKDTPLHIVSSYPDYKRVKQFYQILLKHPFDVNHQNLKGQSCLEILVEKNNLLTLQFCNEWNLQQIRQLSDENLFNFQATNPHTKLSLLDKAILMKNRTIQLFFIDFKLTPITYQTLMICFLPKIRNLFIYKILRKEQMKQISIYLTTEIEIEESEEEQEPCIKLNLEDQEEDMENSFDDDQMSNVSDNVPCQVSENLNKLNSWTPKFQSVRGAPSNLRKSFYDILSNLTECTPPEDEISVINMKDITHGNKLVTKKHMDQYYRLEQRIRGSKHNLKQHNYSPNNIKMIENRNSIFKQDNYHQKRQLAILQKQMRQIIISVHNHLRESNQSNKRVIAQYCRTQFHILDQFINSKVGRELVLIDKHIQTEIKGLRVIIEQDIFPSENNVLNQFDLLK